jgi:uncharacterized membrane protein
MRLVFQPIWSWPAVVIAIVLLIAMVLVTYPPRIRHLPPFYRRLLLGLRLLAAVVLALAMLRPALQHRQPDTDKPVLFIVVDASRSMGTKDGPGSISRRQQVLKLLADVDPQIKALADKIEIRYFNFAGNLSGVEKLTDITDGDQTAIGTVLDELLTEARSERVVGVVFMSDGAQRAHSTNDADPRDRARRLGQNRVPVFAVGFGGSGLADTGGDVKVESLLVAPVVFEKKLVHVDATIRARGADGRKLEIQLIVEDRNGKLHTQPGVMLTPDKESNTTPRLSLTVTSDNQLIPVRLSFIPQYAGEYKIGVKVTPLDRELLTANNEQVTIIKVRSGGIRVVYFDTPLRFEQKFIRDINTSDNIQLDWKPVLIGRNNRLPHIDAELFEPGRYDAYIIGDLPARIFEEQKKNLLDELAARVNQGAGLLMTGGLHTFSPGGYADNEAFVELLPVVLSKFDRRGDNELDLTQQYDKRLKMVPTAAGLRHFVTLLDSPEAANRKLWESLPALQGANKLEAKELGFIDVLARAETGEPLLIGRFEGPRVMAFAADTTFLWYLGGKEEAHQRFWRQMILWLTGNEQGDQNIWVQVEPRNLAPKQPVGFTFGARDEDNKPISSATFTVTVFGPDGKEFKVPARKSGNQNIAEFRATDKPGDYWVQVRAKYPVVTDGKEVILKTEGWSRFIVEDRDLEMDNPAADFELLKDIALSTGGIFMQPEEFSSFLELKAGEDDPIVVSRLRQTSLWDNWTFLMSFVVLMSAEWFVRKRRGLV